MFKVSKVGKDSSLSVSGSASSSNAWRIVNETSTHNSANDSRHTTEHENKSGNTTTTTITNSSINNSNSSCANIKSKVHLTSPEAWVKEFAQFANPSMNNVSSASLLPSVEVLEQAYRFSCYCRHNTPTLPHNSEGKIVYADNNNNKKSNCIAFPTCLAGLQTLRTSPEALKACAHALVGAIPPLYEMSFDKCKSSNMEVEHEELKAQSSITNTFNNNISQIYNTTTTTDNTNSNNLSNKRHSAALIHTNSVCLWRGLRNLSNTCYLNSVLQLLFGIAPIRRVILYDEVHHEQTLYKDKVRKISETLTAASAIVQTSHTTTTTNNNQKNSTSVDTSNNIPEKHTHTKGSHKTHSNNSSVNTNKQPETKRATSSALSQLQLQLLQQQQQQQQQQEQSSIGSTAQISPLQESGLPVIFAEMAYSLVGIGADPTILAQYLSLDVTQQQDAQEFLLLLIDWLRTHCSSSVSATLDRTFCGTLLYDRQCDACGRSSTRAEVLCPLSLPVASTLEECLEHFLRSERVDGFSCEGCKSTSTTATSRQYLRKLPPVLLIHLNHFVFDEKDMQRRKIGTAVTFPQLLDLTRYMQRWHEDQKRVRAANVLQTPQEAERAKKAVNSEHETEVMGCNVSHDSTNTPNDKHVSCKYELRGILNHLGPTALYGHYTYHEKVPLRVRTRNCSSPHSNSASLAGGEHSIHTKHLTSMQHTEKCQPMSLEEQHPEEEQQQEEEEEYVWLEFNDNEVNELKSMRSSHVTSKDAYVLVYHRVEDSTTTPTPTLHKVDTKPVQTFAPATYHEFPSYAIQHVQNQNAQLLERRQEWRNEVNNIYALLQQWATAAQCVFSVQKSNEKNITNALSSTTTTTNKAEEPITNNKIINKADIKEQSWQVGKVDEIYVVPTFWLKAFGNAFLPPYIATSKFGEWEEEQQEHLRSLNMTSEINNNNNNNNSSNSSNSSVDIATSKLYNVAEQTNKSEDNSKNKPTPAGCISNSNSSSISNNNISHAIIHHNENTNITNTGIIMLADGANKYLLSQPLQLLCTAHRKLLPLSDYKLINQKSFDAIMSYVKTCCYVLQQIEQMKNKQRTSQVIVPSHIDELHNNNNNNNNNNDSDNTTTSRSSYNKVGQVHVPCLIHINNTNKLDKLCVSCVRKYAGMITKLASAIAHDKEINVQLLESELGIKSSRQATTHTNSIFSSSSSAGNVSSNNNNNSSINNNTIGTDESNRNKASEHDRVYASERVVLIWETYMKEIDKWEAEMNESLGTPLGVIQFLCKQIARQPSQDQQYKALAMLPVASLIKSLTSLVLPSPSNATARNQTKTVAEEVLCPHGTLKVESVVKSVPLFVYEYWIKRFAQLIALVYSCNSTKEEEKVNKTNTNDINNNNNNNSSNKSSSSSGCFAERVKQQQQQEEKENIHPNAECNVNNDSSISNGPNAEVIKPIEEMIVQRMLPLLLAQSTRRCELCVRNVVAATASRHHLKLLKMEEARKFPTLWAAGKLTSPLAIHNLLSETHLETIEQLLLAKHPNKDYFKRPIKQSYRDALKSWKEEQEYRIGKLQKTLEYLNSKAEKNRALEIPITEARGRRRYQRRGNESNNSNSNNNSNNNSYHSQPPNPHTLEGRIYKLERELAHMQRELENPPVNVQELFGCIPTSWVAAWYAYIVEGKSHHHDHQESEFITEKENNEDSDSDSDSNSSISSISNNNNDDEDDNDNKIVNEVSETAVKAEAKKLPKRKKVNKQRHQLAVPLIDYSKYVCAEHHKCLLETHWLNPADSFWQGGKMKQAHLLWNMHTTANNNNNNNNNSGSNNDNNHHHYYISRNEWLNYTPPLLIVPLPEYVEILKQYGTHNMLSEKVELEQPMEQLSRPPERSSESHEGQPSCKVTEANRPNANVKNECQDDNNMSQGLARKVTYEVNTQKVITLLEQNGERELQPHACTQCTSRMLTELTHQAAYFTFGTLHLQLHLKKSKKQFYDAESTITSRQANNVNHIYNNNNNNNNNMYDHTNNNNDDDTQTYNDNDIETGIHHFTTLAKLRRIIADHIFHYHHYALPEDKLVIMRSRNKPLKVKNVTPEELEKQQEQAKQIQHEEHHGNSESCVEKTNAIDNSNNSNNGSNKKDSCSNPLDNCTLFQLDVHDGDTLMVNLTDAIAVSCVDDSVRESKNYNNTNVSLLHPSLSLSPSSSYPLTSVDNNTISNNNAKSSNKNIIKSKSKGNKSEKQKGVAAAAAANNNNDNDYEEEVWQEIPPELLIDTSALPQQQAAMGFINNNNNNSSSNNNTSSNTYNNNNTKLHADRRGGENAFAETKLHGKKPNTSTKDHTHHHHHQHHHSSMDTSATFTNANSFNNSSNKDGNVSNNSMHNNFCSGSFSSAASIPQEPIGVSCPRCTYLNAAGMVVCEMCEIPLPRQR